MARSGIKWKEMKEIGKGRARGVPQLQWRHIQHKSDLWSSPAALGSTPPSRISPAETTCVSRSCPH
jgi:hypothetical protein